MISQGSGNKTDQPIFSRLWGSGFLPSEHQGVRFRSGSDPVLYLTNPPGIDADARRDMLDGVDELNQHGRARRSAIRRSTRASPNMRWRIRMQTSRAGPDRSVATNRKHTLDMYGIDDNADRRRLRPQLPARPAHGRARRAVRPAHAPRLGPAQQTCPARFAGSARTSINPPPPWSRTSSSAACSMTRW